MQDYLRLFQCKEIGNVIKTTGQKNFYSINFPYLNFNLRYWCLIKNNCQQPSKKYRKREACHNTQYKGISQKHETNYKHPLLP